MWLRQKWLIEHVSANLANAPQKFILLLLASPFENLLIKFTTRILQHIFLWHKREISNWHKKEISVQSTNTSFWVFAFLSCNCYINKVISFVPQSQLTGCVRRTCENNSQFSSAARRVSFPVPPAAVYYNIGNEWVCVCLRRTQNGRFERVSQNGRSASTKRDFPHRLTQRRTTKELILSHVCVWRNITCNITHASYTT